MVAEVAVDMLRAAAEGMVAVVAEGMVAVDMLRAAVAAAAVLASAEVVGTAAEAALTWALDRRYPVRLRGRLPAATSNARYPAARP